MNHKVIITAALTGSTPTKQQNPNLPITPDEIVESAIEARNAGAAIVHIHVRNIQTGKHTNEIDLYREIVDKIHNRSDLILNLTTSFGGTLVVDENGTVDQKQSQLLSPHKRVEHVLALKPEMCSLDIGSVNFGWRIFANDDKIVAKMAEIIKGTSTKPEIELFDIGHIELAKKLQDKNLLKGTPHFQLCMGTAGGIAATPTNAVHFINSLPEGCTWSIFGVGRSQFDMIAIGALMGGHVRVGMEDNLYLKKGVPAESNAQLVARAVEIIRNLNRKIATVEEAKSILNLN